MKIEAKYDHSVKVFSMQNKYSLATSTSPDLVPVTVSSMCDRDVTEHAKCQSEQTVCYTGSHRKTRLSSQFCYVAKACIEVLASTS